VESLLPWPPVLVLLALLDEELPLLLWLYVLLFPLIICHRLLTVIRALLLVLVVLPLQASPVSLVVLLASQVVVVSSTDSDILEHSLTISKPLLLVSLAASLPQLASPEAPSSLHPASTPVVLHPLDSSLLLEDRLCRHWINRVIRMVQKKDTISLPRPNILPDRRTKGLDTGSNVEIMSLGHTKCM
jgi:hypothetical protein